MNDPDHPNGIEMTFLADIKGSYNTGGLPMTIRFECGGKDHTVNQEPLVPGVPFECQYDRTRRAHRSPSPPSSPSAGVHLPTNGPGLDV